MLSHEQCSRARRQLSSLRNDWPAARLRSGRLRAALYPAGALHSGAMAHWQQGLTQALQDRQPMARRGWIIRQP